MEAYIFRATCTNVVDGDTIDCMVDVGFGMYTKQRFRLWGVNTPETRTKDLTEKALGLLAKQYTTSLVAGKEIMLQTYKDDSFGRYLAKVFIPREMVEGEQTYECLNELLLLEELAKPFMADTDLLEV